MNKYFLYIILIVIAGNSCTVGKYLPAGETLYRGAYVKVNKQAGVKVSSAVLRRQLLYAARPAANKFLFGRPYLVWWWYVIGAGKRKSGLRIFFRNLLGEQPILSSRVNPTVTAQNMTAYLENIGYFHSAVVGESISKGYLSKAIYSATVAPRYTIRNMEWINDSSAVVNALNDKTTSILKKGLPYRISDIDAERQQLDVRIKTKGYYFFNSNYIMVYADSSVGKHEVDLFFKIKDEAPDNARHVYTINQINIFPNYTLLAPPLDTGSVSSVNEDGLLIHDTAHQFKHLLFKEMITYRPGDKYNSEDQNITLNRFINLGSLKFVKNKYEVIKDTIDHYKLNVFYYLTAAQKKSVQAGIDAFSNENKYIGSAVSLTWKNRNIFKGSEQLAFKMYGGMNLCFNDTINNNTNFRVGSELSLNFPKYIIPFVHLKDKNLYPARTQFFLGYEYFIRPGFYTRNIYRFNYEFQWRENPNKQHILAPISITYFNSPVIKDSFLKAVAIKSSLINNIYSEIIIGSNYSFTYNTLNPSVNDQWFFNATIEAAGNFAGLFSGAKSPRSKLIFGTPFAQYIKGEIDLRYTKRFSEFLQWASRLQIGMALPYNNSNVLPFLKQYIIGGASSIRAYAVRSLGPGTYKPTLNDKTYYQTIGGDFKLLINTELRFPIKGRFSGATFIDMGNIWTKDTTLFGRAGQLKKDFLKELAIAAGAGLRIDIGLFLLRLDIGIPIRKPYLPDGQRLVIDKIAIGNSNWRRDNLNFNFAIGYPF